MHECSIERKAMKDIGMRVDSYRDLITELHFVVEDLRARVPKKGKWIKNADGWISCDQCGRRPLSNVMGETVYSKFCPHCGAKMEVENENA